MCAINLNSNRTFKKGLVVFWFLFWVVTFLTDLGGTFSKLGWVHQTWLFPDNFNNLVDSLNIYHAPFGLVLFLFAGILLWSFLCMILFLRSVIAFHQKDLWFERAKTAFIVSIFYWLAFFLADTIVYKFDLLENHIVQGGFALLTYFVMYLLPDQDDSKRL